jgi:hypothetical protein
MEPARVKFYPFSSRNFPKASPGQSCRLQIA